MRYRNYILLLRLSPIRKNRCLQISHWTLIISDIEQLKGGVAGHLLISRDVVLSLCLEVPMNANPQLSEVPPPLEEGEELPEKGPDATAASTTASYYAEFDCKELPNEGYMQLELIGKNEGQIYADLKFVIKVITNPTMFSTSIFNIF